MAKKPSFEEALARLEAITNELENENLNLDSALKKFDEGMKLVDFCSASLDEAQKRIDMLVKKGAGLDVMPFPYAETDGE